MFKQFQNIDTAFRHIRLFSIVFLACNCILSGYLIYSTKKEIQFYQSRVYVLANGKLLEAIKTERKDSLSVEITDHVKTFHYYFFNLDPDDEVIKKHITKALYLADGTAKGIYDNLTEQGYYSNIISSNINQFVEADSVVVNIDKTPYHFKYYGKLKIIRPTTIAIRSLITEGNIRVLQAVSNNNAHGLLIERWNILENKDLSVERR